MPTIAQQLTQLESDRQDLVDNLETKGITGLTGDETFTELVPEVLNISGGTPSITSYTQLRNESINVMNSYSNYLKSVFNSYPTYTNNYVTLYTPDSDCTNYMIHKRSNGKYRVIWFLNDNNSSITSDTTVSYSRSTGGWFADFSLETLEYNTTNFNPTPIIISTVTASSKAYYSNELNTIEDVIQNMQLQNGSLTYTRWTSGTGFGAVLDSPYLIPYSNTLVFDLRYQVSSQGISPVLSQKISNNETVVTIS